MFLDFFFILLGRTRSNAFRFGLDLVRPWTVETLSTVHVNSGEYRRQRRRRKGRGKAVVGGENNGGRWWATLRCSHATWTVKNAEDEGEGEGEGEEQWLAVKMAEACGELLSTVHINSEERKRWRRRGRGRAVAGDGNNGGRWWAALHSPLFTSKGEGEKEEQWLAMETAEVGGELLSTLHCSREREKGKRKSSGWRWKQRRLVVSCSPLFTWKGEGEEEEQWLAVKMVEVGGERELLSTVHYSLLYFCSFSCGLCL